MEDISKEHLAVMADEVVEFLNLKPGKKILDCTVGSGGLSKKIISKIMPDGLLIGLDYDTKAIEKADNNLLDFKGHYILIKENFRNVDKVLERLNLREIDGAVMDLGISSMQLNDQERGLSFKLEGPLDMRLDQDNPTTCENLINKANFNQLDRIIKEYGEEPFHRRIAMAIVEKRRERRIKTTTELVNIIIGALPYKRRHLRIHPATRTFMALRIAVNNELENLEVALSKIFDCISFLSRVCVISFHSLEDRIVKNKFKELKEKEIVRILTKKPLIPAYSEIISNPRARSAKLRVAEKI